MTTTSQRSTTHPDGGYRAGPENLPIGYGWELLTREIHAYIDPSSAAYDPIRAQRWLLDRMGAQQAEPGEVLSPAMRELLRHMSPLPIQSARVGWPHDPERPNKPPVMILEVTLHDETNFPDSGSVMYFSSMTAQPRDLAVLSPTGIDPVVYEEATLGPDAYPSVMTYELIPPNR